MKTFSTKELGERLASETYNCTELWFESNKGKKLDKQYWLFLHLGWIAMMKLHGYTDKECDQVLDIANDFISQKMK
jgi:hypothetical protein